MDWTKAHVVGIGDDGPAGLGSARQEIIRQAQFLAGGERHLAFFPDHPAEKMTVKSNLKELVVRMESGFVRKERMVVLASGDPMFYGIGTYLAKKFPEGRVVIHPFVSAMQLAFAAAQLSWEEAELVSVHAKPIERVLAPARRSRVIGVFTEDGTTPGKIAAFLKSHGVDGFDAIVCEKLGGDKQSITRLPLNDLNGRTFDPLNTMILVRHDTPTAEGTPDRLEIGLPEESFAHRKPKLGLITKSEVRILSLAKLRLFDSAVVWDVGAGSGSVSIEAARIAANGKVYAIEKNEEDIENVRENVRRFNTPHVTAIHGIAPDAFEKIPDSPDAVFVGGTSGRLFDIIEAVLRRLNQGGRIVLNFATVENLAECFAALKKLDMAYESMQIQISRGSPILEMTRFEALNPVTVVTAWRKSDR